MRVARPRFCPPKISDAAHQNEANDEQTYDSNSDDVRLPRKRVYNDFRVNLADESIAHIAVVELHTSVDKGRTLLKVIVILNPDVFGVSKKS